MKREEPPWGRPAAAFAPVTAGGPFVRPGRRLGKPQETVGRKATELRCHGKPWYYVRRVAGVANHRKLWDAKLKFRGLNRHRIG